MFQLDCGASVADARQPQLREDQAGGFARVVHVVRRESPGQGDFHFSSPHPSVFGVRAAQRQLSRLRYYVPLQTCYNLPISSF